MPNLGTDQLGRNLLLVQQFKELKRHRKEQEAQRKTHAEVEKARQEFERSKAIADTYGKEADGYLRYIFDPNTDASPEAKAHAWQQYLRASTKRAGALGEETEFGGESIRDAFSGADPGGSQFGLDRELGPGALTGGGAEPVYRTPRETLADRMGGILPSTHPIFQQGPKRAADIAYTGAQADEARARIPGLQADARTKAAGAQVAEGTIPDLIAAAGLANEESRGRAGKLGAETIATRGAEQRAGSLFPGQMEEQALKNLGLGLGNEEAALRQTRLPDILSAELRRTLGQAGQAEATGQALRSLTPDRRADIQASALVKRTQAAAIPQQVGIQRRLAKVQEDEVGLNRLRYNLEKNIQDGKTPMARANLQKINAEIKRSLASADPPADLKARMDAYLRIMSAVGGNPAKGQMINEYAAKAEDAVRAMGEWNFEQQAMGSGLDEEEAGVIRRLFSAGRTPEQIIAHPDHQSLPPERAAKMEALLPLLYQRWQRIGQNAPPPKK